MTGGWLKVQFLPGESDEGIPAIRGDRFAASRILASVQQTQVRFSVRLGEIPRSIPLADLARWCLFVEDAHKASR